MRAELAPVSLTSENLPKSDRSPDQTNICECKCRNDIDIVKENTQEDINYHDKVFAALEKLQKTIEAVSMSTTFQRSGTCSDICDFQNQNQAPAPEVVATQMIKIEGALGGSHTPTTSNEQEDGPEQWRQVFPLSICGKSMLSLTQNPRDLLGTITRRSPS